MKMKKIVSAIAALSLVAALAVGGTLAYLTKSTPEVKNTFTYNATTQNITLDLYEGTYDPDGTTADHPNWVGSVGEAATDKAMKNENYVIIPGATAPKNPTLFLTTESKSYIYAEVVANENGVVTPNMADGWTEMLGVEGIHGGTMYYLADCAAAGVSGTEAAYQVLTSVTYDADMELTNTNETVSVYGYAIAVAGMGSVTEAWNTAKADFQA